MNLIRLNKTSLTNKAREPNKPEGSALAEYLTVTNAAKQLVAIVAINQQASSVNLLVWLIQRRSSAAEHNKTPKEVIFAYVFASNQRNTLNSSNSFHTVATAYGAIVTFLPSGAPGKLAYRLCFYYNLN